MIKKNLRLAAVKKGQTTLFTPEGKAVCCTVLQMEPNLVASIRSEEKHGYKAVQVAAMPCKTTKNLPKPQKKFYEKNNLPPCQYLFESRIEDFQDVEVGKELTVDLFEGVKFVDVMGISKGKGYQGVMKRHNFKGGPAAHGSGFHRLAGSTGQRSTPGRCLPQTKGSGQMGSDRKTIENLAIFKVDSEKKLLIVRGAVPGAIGAVVYVKKSNKKGG